MTISDVSCPSTSDPRHLQQVAAAFAAPASVAIGQQAGVFGTKGCAVPDREPCSGPSPGFAGRQGSSTRTRTSGGTSGPVSPGPWAARRAGTRTCRRSTCPNSKCSCSASSKMDGVFLSGWSELRENQSVRSAECNRINGEQ